MEKENVEENHEQEEGVTTMKKKKKTKKMTGEHESSDLNSHSLVIALPATKKIEEGKNVSSKKKDRKEKKIGNAVENVQEGKNVASKKKKKDRKEKKIGNAAENVQEGKNVASEKKDRKEKKIGNAVENVQEGSVSEKKIKKKKHKKVISDATENVEGNKLELDEESMQDLPVVVKTKPDSKMTESCKEIGLEEKKISRKKKRDKNAMEVTQGIMVEGKMEVGLPTIADDSNEAVSEHNKRRRRKKKRCLLSGGVDMEQTTLEEAMQELMVKVKPAAAAQTEENHVEVDTDMKKRKRKKKKEKMRHGSPECTKMDTKPLEDNLQDLSVKEKSEAVQQAVENHEEVNTGQKVKKVKKQQLSSSENGDGNQSQLKSNLEMKVSNTPGNALLTSENHEEISTAKKRRMKKKKGMTAGEHDERHQMLEEGSLELQLPVESGLKASLLAEENHVSRIKDKSTVCKVKASNDASVHDLSIKQTVEKSGVSSSELLREVKQGSTIGGENKEISVTDCNKEKGLCYASIEDATKDFCFQDGTSKECKSTQLVLDSPKRAPISCTGRKLLILDLNGLLVDIVMVVPHGYKAEKRIGPKSAFKRPFCDDFLKFCFERFEVGVWTSRTKKNMDDVLNFLMADTKHKLLFCWDQSHCTMTGMNTIDNRHKPLVCKELKKLWDKHEPSLPWEKGEYNESNTLLLDDSPYKALLNPPNTAIFPYSYSFLDKSDNSLGPEGDIRLYLEGVAAAEDVQKYVKQHPFGQPAITNTSSSWGFYSRVLDQFKRQLD